MQTVHRARRTWSRDVDAIIALTAFGRDRLIEGGLPADRLVVRPNFVEVQAPLDTGPGTGFVYAGRLTEDKGVDILIDAWRQARIDSTLTIMGAGPLESLVLAASEEMPSIRFLGVMPRQDLLEVMARSRAVIVPSRWYEGFPLTVLEAFACRRPVIAAGHGSLAEVVTDGENGLTFRPSDPADLADRIRWADANVQAAGVLGKASRATYEANYTPQRGYETLVAVYRRALAVRGERTEA
jgi:glycosyltransferase involved in cell wall biosynthesis